MQRNDQIEASIFVDSPDLLKQIAFHEAGHAVAIVLGNKQKRLPPVCFQVSITRSEQSAGMMPRHIRARVDNGLLISSLPITLIESASYFSNVDQDVYRTAFEADMVNLLVGPLAEAKYVALRDGEAFSGQLVDLNALLHYGGSYDLNTVQEYLDSYIADRHRRAEKLNELFAQALQFIDTVHHWQAIQRLANYLLHHVDQVIHHETVFALLDS